MIGMATRTSQRKPKAGSAKSKSKDLSPTKVLALVAKWNNTSPVKESPKRKRSRDERLSASVPRSSRQKKASQKCYLSASSDDDEIPSFKANSFYHNAKRTRYLSPYERKEQLERLIDAGVDPKTLNRSFDDPQRDGSSRHSHPVGEVAGDSNGKSATKAKPRKKYSRKDVRTSLTSNLNTGAAATKKGSQAPKPNGVTPGRMQQLHNGKMAAGQTCGGEIKVTLSERSQSRSPERRSSPRKSNGSLSPSKASAAPETQWRRTSPRKSVLKPSANRGIQMYVKNLKTSQKKGVKKAESNIQRVKVQPKVQTKVAKPKVSSASSPVSVSLPEDLASLESCNASSARGLDFGKSNVNPQDVSALDESFEEKTSESPLNQSNDLMDFLIFHDEDFHDDEDNDVGHEKGDFIQNLLLEIDDDLGEAGETLAKRSPRKRKMKTEKESMTSPSPSSSRGTPSRKRLSSTPVSSKKSTQPRLDEWLTQLGAKAPTSPPDKKKLAVQRSKVASEGTVAMTPESSESSSPKVPSVATPDKLYPVFTTPPSSPHVGTNGTPASRKKKGIMGNVKAPKRSPLLKSLKAKNDPLEQMTLDLGQKRYGAVTCATCGTIYTAAHPEDEADHAKFHKKYLSSIKFPGWKQEEVLEEFHDGRVIVVTHDAPRYAEKKVDEVKELVDRELGYLEPNPEASKDLCKTYLFVTTDKKVGGCLIAEQISKGYRVIIDDKKATRDGSVQDSQKAWCCETESEPALCGVSRIWVPMANRRKAIASRMLDCVRKNFMFGTILSPNDIAFSDPTPDGKVFATRYTGTPRFLVYKYH